MCLAELKQNQVRKGFWTTPCWEAHSTYDACCTDSAVLSSTLTCCPQPVLDQLMDRVFYHDHYYQWTF